MTTPAVDNALIAAAAATLRAGGIVCFPTETMYGLAADIRRADALARLVDLKGRAETAPFGLIVSEVSQAIALCRVWPPAAADLAAAHWPGPLTIVAPARADLPACLVGPGGGVGMRLSSHPWAIALAAAVGGPITATSANPGGLPPALDVATARGYFAAAVAHYLDAGPSAQTTPSTVAAVGETGEIRILRPGAIDLQTPGS